MDFDFERVLFYIIAICSIIVLTDFLLFSSRRKKTENKKLPIIVEYARSFLPVLILVFLFRSFAFEGFRIPSGSLKPTLLVGDFIVVNKFEYGIRLPILRKKLFAINDPQRGDIVVFHEVGENSSRDLIKRVIGLPGDHVVYKDKTLYINDKKAEQTLLGYDTDADEGLLAWSVEKKQENLLGIKHNIFLIPLKENDDFDVIVPKDHYFMMGDNRDDSGDSRYWGFLPDENIIGKAEYVVISTESLKHPLRFDRIGLKIV